MRPLGTWSWSWPKEGQQGIFVMCLVGMWCAAIPCSSGLGWFQGKLGYISKPLKCRELWSAERATHGFVGYVFKDFGCFRQVAFQIWSCPENHIKRSWRPVALNFPAFNQSHISYLISLHSIPRPHQPEHLALWDPWEHHNSTVWINLCRTKISFLKTFSINSLQQLLAKFHHTQQECAVGNIKHCSCPQPELEQQWLSEAHTAGHTKLWGTGWVCCLPEFSKQVFEIWVDQILS